MQKTNTDRYDILIAGGGFAGSLTALALHKSGLKVCLLDKGKHPRFTIGESSTPVADMILRNLSSKYDLPWLYDFSRYGSWQKSHPEIICGVKRGFSFFKHYPHEKFTTDESHQNELLVAASSSDDLSDTNWLREDFDSFLINKVKENGITYFDLTEITKAVRTSEWMFDVARLEQQRSIFADFFIDATGNGKLAEQFLNVQSSSDDFLTDSFSVFSHFNNVPFWTHLLQDAGISTSDYPYNPDHSAIHQVLDEGWMWMLRFNDQRTSVGFVLDAKQSGYSGLSTEKIWNSLLAKYPTITAVLKDAKVHKQPGKIIRSGRLQRKLNQCYGEGWAALPHTIGFVDPLFSSGIAFALSGIEKLLDIIIRNWGNAQSVDKNLKEYQEKVFRELKLIDCLVSGSYKTMDQFALFSAWSMLYFAATIAHEQRRLKNCSAGYFLNADDAAINEMVYSSYGELLQLIAGKPSPGEIDCFTNRIRTKIKPFNTAGLLDPSLKNMYRHTAAAM